MCEDVEVYISFKEQEKEVKSEHYCLFAYPPKLIFATRLMETNQPEQSGLSRRGLPLKRQKLKLPVTDRG